MLTQDDYTVRERELAAACIHVGRELGHDDAACVLIAERYFRERGLRDPLPLLWTWLPEAHRRAHGLEQPQPQFDRRAQH